MNQCCNNNCNQGRNCPAKVASVKRSYTKYELQQNANIQNERLILIFQFFIFAFLIITTLIICFLV